MNIETIAVGEFQANCFVLWGDPGKAIVIDPGSDAGIVLSLLSSKRLTVAVYLLTHGHVDHVSAVADMCRAMPAPVAIHKADLNWTFTDANEMLPFYPAPQRPAAEIRALEDDAECTDAGLACRIISTPGHTPGSACFLFGGENVLFSGDTLFAGSVGRTDLPGGNSRSLTLSLARLAKLGDEITVYPGHGPVTSIGQERRTNFFMQKY